MVKASGLRWLGCMVLPPIAWAKRVWALPFLTVLCPSARFYAQRGRRHHTVLGAPGKASGSCGAGCTDRELVFVADSSFAALEWLALVARLPRVQCDHAPAARCRLQSPAAACTRTARSPRLKGETPADPGDGVVDEKMRWSTLTVEDWYGEGPHVRFEVTTDTAVWYHAGKPPVAIRWVLIRDPQARFKPQALLATNLEDTCAQMLAWFVRRWTMEVTFEEARAHLGMETQRQWNDRAIARATPALLSLYSVSTLTAHLLIDKVRPGGAARHGMAKRAPRFRSDSLGAATLVGAHPFFHVPTGD